MLGFRTRPVLYLLLFLLPVNSFANHRYVNINNPTPGAGTSWATAFTDLNAAAATLSIFDTIWVAQGIYKPTGVGRAATFLFQSGSVCGGFNGTETAFSQRDPKVNLTVLSGDIGVTGDASDNCYHVVTLWHFNGSSVVDGFTIRDGNANAGYPGSTAFQPDNSGGGVIGLANTPGDLSYSGIGHCIITNNFAVYGGGFCAYGDGQGSTNHAQSWGSITTSLFDNNTAAVMGGALAIFTMNQDWGGTTIYNCIFTNNNCTGAQGSVLACYADNPYTGATRSTMDNCTLYDNGSPVVYNQPIGSTVSNIELTNDIVWKSGAPYPGPVVTGANVPFFNNSDVYLVTPLVGGGNLDADPLFVNAAGNDFHLTTCSPCIDMGYDLFNVTTDFEGTMRPQGGAKDMGAYEFAGANSIPAAPTVTSPSFCQNATATALTATGTNLLWYTAAAGGTGSSTAPVPSTTATGTTIYYVTQTTGGCESARKPITVTIKSLPAVPTATSPTYCQNATATALTATGTSILWYTVATGGSGSSTAPVPSTATVGATTWYVTQTTGGCESNRTSVTVTINGASAAPTATSPSYCKNATATALTATGTNLLWYTVATGGSGNATAPVPSTATAGATTWYVTQTPSGSCESTRTPVTVTVGNPATAPTGTSPSYCQNVTATALTATGSNLLWYTTATGGTGNATAPVPSTTSAGTTTWYVTQTPSGSCESARTPLTVTINGASAAPTGTSPSYCQNATATALTATGSNLLWYTVASGGTGNATAPVPSTVSTGTTTWYVTQTPVGSCESGRTSITVTVGSPATAPTAASSSYCQNATATALTATGSNLLWYTAATGGTGSATAPVPSTAAAGTTTWYVTQTPAGSCESGRTNVTVTINANPVVDVSPVSGSLCVGGSVTLTATGASTYQWSPATGLSDAASSSPVAALQTNIVYTVTGTDNNGCINTAQITLKPGTCQVYNTGYNIPDAFTPNGDGKNDLFRVLTSDVPQSFRMLIFNRYGQKVFETRDIQTGWNGYMGSNPAITGAYVYSIVIKTSAGTTIEKKGTVLVVR